MTYLCKGHVKVFVNARFTYPKLKKCRTKSVDLRHPSFGISFDSRGKRNFFPKPLFYFLLSFSNRFFLNLIARSSFVFSLSIFFGAIAFISPSEREAA